MHVVAVRSVALWSGSPAGSRNPPDGHDVYYNPKHGLDKDSEVETEGQQKASFNKQK